MAKDEQLDLFQPPLHPATQEIMDVINGANHAAELQGLAPTIGRLLVDHRVPMEEFDMATEAFRARKASFRASPEVVVADIEPDIAPDPHPEPLSSTRPMPPQVAEQETTRPRDFRELQFKD